MSCSASWGIGNVKEWLSMLRSLETKPFLGLGGLFGAALAASFSLFFFLKGLI